MRALLSLGPGARAAMAPRHLSPRLTPARRRAGPHSRCPPVVVLQKAAAAGGGGFLESQLVMDEASAIMRDFAGLSQMMGKYAAFDTEGKRLFLDQMQSVCDRLRIFHTRASLSDDPAVKECLTTLSRQLLFLSTNTNSVYDGFQAQIDEYRRLLAEEEKIVDPERAAAFRRQLAAAMPSPDMSRVSKNLSMEAIMADPSVMATISSNPRALKAIDDCFTRGPAVALEAYREDPALYAALKKLFDV